jgi:hypothetical protein
MPTRTRLMPAALAASVALCAGGCSLMEMRPSGKMRSLDEFTYVSTPYQPITITLIDTRDNQEFWSTDVPIGKKLTIRFYKNKGEGSAYAPDIMRWSIYDQKTHSTRLRNQITVPPADSRRIDYTLREGPEYPQEIEMARTIPESPASSPVAPVSGDHRFRGPDSFEVGSGEGADPFVTPANDQMIDVGVATGAPEFDTGDALGSVETQDD